MRSTSSRFAYTIPVFFYQAASASAYSWSFKEPPKQCADLVINIDGNDGKPPYRVLIIPYGPSPLPNNIEARTILDIPFDGTSTSLSFKLKYPENSQFVAVVSDANGFGSGGTSVAGQVVASDDDSCFDSKSSVQPQFFFSIEPPNQIVQCTDTRLWWDPASVQGTPNFLGVIPGGQSFAIPQSRITQVDSQGTGFTWNANLRSGTTLILVGGDARGNGTAGSSLNVVSAGINPNTNCLNNTSPSSTPGSPAGGSYPTGTGTTTPGGGSDGSGGSNVGAIVGGVVGGVVAILALLLLLYFLRKRQRERARQREKPLNIIDQDEDGDDGENADNRNRNDLPQFYQPEPFTVPDPTVAGSTIDTESANGSRRPLSVATSTSWYTSQRPSTPDGSQVLGGAATTTSRKGAPPRMMRPVNIIQHDDAGPSYPPPPQDEGETIELPPAYTALKSGGPQGTGSSSS